MSRNRTWTNSGRFYKSIGPNYDGEGGEEPKENPRRHQENMIRELNRSPSCCVGTVLNTEPPCWHQTCPRYSTKDKSFSFINEDRAEQNLTNKGVSVLKYIFYTMNYDGTKQRVVVYHLPPTLDNNNPPEKGSTHVTLE